MANEAWTTRHRLIVGDARRPEDAIKDPIDLVVTSPPYPMVEMWDEVFGSLDPAVGRALGAEDSWGAFEAMHGVLDEVWHVLFQLVRPGGFACINVGDATRSIGDQGFTLFPNHARIGSGMRAAGFTPLPGIVWRKPTNAPTKFMGSGVLPAGAYVTLEHEHILVFRKGARRRFEGQEAGRRARSAIFWEERNRWFSDAWTLAGARQDAKTMDRRTAAFPPELPFRLIHMFSAQHDVIVDPFLGTGSTMLAAMASGRSSVGMEVDGSLADVVAGRVEAERGALADRCRRRLVDHEAFVKERAAQGRAPKHTSRLYGFPVVTRQETELVVPEWTQTEAAGRGEWTAKVRPMAWGEIAPGALAK